MGKVLSLVRNPLRNYNLESRAHKVISMEKPVPAPRHRSDAEDLERVRKEHPGLLQELQTKHSELDGYLKDVYVKSFDPEIKKASNPDRPLPADRKIVEDFELGHKEPTKAPLGKVTLRNALRFITDHQADPLRYSAEKIAADLELDERKVVNILKYCRVFEVYLPEEKSKAFFAAQSVPKQPKRIARTKLLADRTKSDNT